MTTIPADPSLDVSSRLANLRTWQTEWQRIDHELEEQVSNLDGNNLLELQQSVHISNVRRRMAMTLVKQPLSVPESLLKQLGVVRFANSSPSSSRALPVRNGFSGLIPSSFS